MSELRVNINECELKEVNGTMIYIYEGEEYYPYEVSPFGFVRLVKKTEWQHKLDLAYEELNRNLRKDF